MLTLIRYELLKTYGKLRTFIGFALIAVLIPLVYWGLAASGEDMIDGMTYRLQQDFVFIGSLFNGWFVSNMVLNTLFVHVPFLILLVAGDMFAGEATSGTYRILLTRPPSRHRIFFVKVISTMLYTGSLVLFLAIASMLPGLLLFGGGDMFIVREDGMAILAQGELWWRFLLAYGLAAWAMCTVAALGTMFSTIVENAVGPVVGSFAVIILFLILGNLPFDFFVQLRPWLFTTYTDVWREAFYDAPDWMSIVSDTGVLLLFWLAFTCVAWWIFLRKNVLS